MHAPTGMISQKPRAAVDHLHEQCHCPTVFQQAEIEYLFRELSHKLYKMIQNRAKDEATYNVVYGSFREISQQAEPDLAQFRKDLHAQETNEPPTGYRGGCLS